jgi:hypothetical protein
MNITQIKSTVGVSTLELRTAKTKKGKPTDWMRHWDNTRRIAVSIHKELVDELKLKPETDSLGLQEETRTGAKGPYLAYRIVNFSNQEPIEETL